MSDTRDEIALATDLLILLDLEEHLKKKRPLSAAKLNAIMTRLRSDGHVATLAEGTPARLIVDRMTKLRIEMNEEILKGTTKHTRGPIAKLTPVEDIDSIEENTA